MVFATVFFFFSAVFQPGNKAPINEDLAHTLKDTSIIENIFLQAKELENQKPDSASFYFQQVIEIADFAIKNSKKSKLNAYYLNKKTIAAYRLGLIDFYQQQFLNAIGHFETALQSAQKSNDSIYLYRCYNCLGLSYFTKGNNADALNNYLKALEMTGRLNLKIEKSSTLLNLGNLYQTIGKFVEAMQSYQQAIELKEELVDTKGLMTIYNNVGALHYKRLEYKKAIDYHLKFLSVSQLAKDTSSIAKAYNNLGLDNIAIKQYDKAKSFFDKAIYYFSIKGDMQNQAVCYNNIGELQLLEKKYREAEQNFLKSIQIREKTGFELTSGLTLVNLAHLYFSQNLFSNAIEYGNKALKLGKEADVLDVQREAYLILYQTYQKTGDFSTSLNYCEQYQDIKDSIINEKKNEAISLIESQYQNQLQEREIENQKIQLEKRNLEILQQEEKFERFRMVRNFLILGTVLLIFVLAIVVNLWISKWKLSANLAEQKKNIHEKNNLLEQLNHEILAQNNQIEEQNTLLIEQKNKVEQVHHKLRESIIYAEHIQHLSLPSHSILNECFEEYFILMQPKEEVGGDFYWVHKDNDQVLVAVGDCTGHGVPGGFLTMLSIALLRGIVKLTRYLDPAIILNQLRVELIESLKQNQDRYETADGIDMSLVRINMKTRELTFSGAKSHAIIISQNKPMILKGQHYSVGWCPRMKEFENQQVLVNPDSTIYLLTDGFTDQFNPETEKFGRKQFINLCVENNHLPLSKQREVFYQTFNQWKGESEQLDDVLVFCFKFT
jgi:serine phosphatase RsbU (regulator of sigma subunit)/Flp pilus assembly protein TadD